ncbi:MAG: LCP family protein [Clostridiales bacterium]|nr:LCP family protein [Clostridiales bacterium]
MGNKEYYKNKRRKRKLIGRFILTVFVIVFVFSAVFVLAATALKSQRDKQEAINSESKSDLSTTIADKKINVAILGTDADEIHSDVNIVVSFDTETGEASFVSVPRDTQVFMSESMMLEMQNSGRSDYIPTKYGTKGECKLCELYAYAGPEKNNEYVVQALESLLNVDIDHYIQINLNAFKEIVDAVGGVDMYVPMDMYWDMRDNGGPLINLKEGQQHLDGDKAEQLVRFRKGYAQQDVGRVSTQQDFIIALISKILDSENVIGDLTKTINAVYKYVTTDVSLGDCISYLKYIPLVDITKISMETIPGEAQNMFIPDLEEIKIMSDRVFRGIIQEPEETTAKDSKQYSIEVSNGGNIMGYAAKTQERLNGLGYNVTKITTWYGNQQDTTIINVKEEGIGEDLVSLFTDAKVVVDPAAVDGDTDIKIIIGLKES